MAYKNNLCMSEKSLDSSADIRHFSLMLYRERILKEIEDYCAAVPLSPRVFGILAVGNPKFIRRLKAGMSSLRSIEKADAYMRAHPGKQP